MLLRYKPCWVTYGEERKEGRKRGRTRTSAKKKEAVAKKKESGVCGDEWSTDYLPQDA